jgi:hypothetical protein
MTMSLLDRVTHSRLFLHLEDTPCDDFFITDQLSTNPYDTSHGHCNTIKSVSFEDLSIHQVCFQRYTTQVDGGADRCTTPHRNLVDNIRPPDPSLGEPLFIYDAGKHKHRVEGIGNFQIETWVDGKASQSLTIPCAYVPTIPSTLVNFRLAKDAIMYGEVSNLVTNEAVGTLIVGSPSRFVGT